MVSMLRVLPITLLSAVGLLACKSVQSSELIGTWVMKGESRQELPTEFQRALPKSSWMQMEHSSPSELPDRVTPRSRDDHSDGRDHMTVVIYNPDTLCAMCSAGWTDLISISHIGSNTRRRCTATLGTACNDAKAPREGMYLFLAPN